MKTMSIENLIAHRISCFFLNGINHSNDVIKGFFLNVPYSNSCMLRNINIIMKRINKNFFDLPLISKYEFKRELYKTETDCDWRVNMIEELMNVRENQLECHLDRHESNMMLKYISIFR